MPFGWESLVTNSQISSKWQPEKSTLPTLSKYKSLANTIKRHFKRFLPNDDSYNIHLKSLIVSSGVKNLCMRAGNRVQSADRRNQSIGRQLWKPLTIVRSVTDRRIFCGSVVKHYWHFVSAHIVKLREPEIILKKTKIAQRNLTIIKFVIRNLSKSIEFCSVCFVESKYTGRCESPNVCCCLHMHDRQCPRNCNLHLYHPAGLPRHGKF